MAFLELLNISVEYERGSSVLSGFSLSVEKGEFVSLLGPSGCGKTTTLRAIAGFLPVVDGEIRVDGKIYNNLPPNKRNMGFVFQNYALFPHLTVFENVAFGLRMRNVSKNIIEKKVLEALSFVGLSGYENRVPSQLSGGQQQRVAIARAIVIQPDLLLMDEPLSNLDAKLRTEMRTELARMQRELRITTVYVTHDQSEALALSDRVAVINKGKIEQYDTPENLYHNPKTIFVAKFMGFESLFKGKVLREDSGYVIIKNKKGETIKGKKMTDLHPSNDAIALSRAGYLKLQKEKTPNSLPTKVVGKIFQGETVLYVVQRDMLVNVELPIKDALWNQDENLFLTYEPDYVLVFEGDSEDND